RYFAWLEQHLQRFKYSSPRGILATVGAERDRLAAALEDARREGLANGQLRLARDFELPRYYTSVEFHQHPGGVWSDPLAGIAYDFGRRTTMPAHLDPDEIHRRFAAAVPPGPYRRILDLGCGTGRSTLPFAARFPAAELHGIDLSAPCLVRAYERSRAAGIRVYWSQQRAEALDYPEGYFDLVHSTFLLHELPLDALHDITQEVLRVLAPGGLFVNLDFHTPPGGVFGDFIHYGHARRNEEVYMRAFAETDYLALQRALGFARAEMQPFDDGSGVYSRAQAPNAWRFPSQLFVAVKGS
ncbi:MAG: class I SAM-dependent methyltransferase, partial [Steroidobacteraceae bacterium]|nr:class I SAM-dependent methyltransferase [Steroidobacteraceae bacterium]